MSPEEMQQLLNLDRLKKQDNSGNPISAFIRNQIDGLSSFVARGEVISLGVGIVVGAAFTQVTETFVTSFLTPMLALMTPDVDGIRSLEFTSNGVVFAYGEFIAAIINFLMISCLLYFLVVAPYNTLQKKLENSRLFFTLKAARERAEQKSKQCAECLSSLNSDARRCKFCGASQEENQKPCPECCSLLSPKAKRCKFCSHNLPRIDKTINVPTSTYKSPKSPAHSSSKGPSTPKSPAKGTTGEASGNPSKSGGESTDKVHPFEIPESA